MADAARGIQAERVPVHLPVPVARNELSSVLPSPYWWWAIGVGSALMLLGLIVLWQAGYFTMPGRAVRVLGHKHYQPGDMPAYNSNPPTSGVHYGDRITPWGFHNEQIEKPLQVANLEKGGVIITYRPKGDPVHVLPDADRDHLEILVRRLRNEPKYCKLILARAGGLEKKIVLTAWGRIDELDAFDEARIRRFIDAYINKGPENAPCL